MSDDAALRDVPTEPRPALRSRRSRPSMTSRSRVVVRPSRARVLLFAAITAGIPTLSRGNAESLLDVALATGPGSRSWVALVGYEVLVVVWGALVLARSATTLTGGAEGALVLEVRTALRRREIPLVEVRRVVLVTVAHRGGATSQRALLLDEAGRVVAPPTHSRQFWLRADTRSLLGAAGVTVDWDHRLSAPRELEAAYPGASVWTDRHPVLLTVLVTIGCLAGLMAVGWLLDA